jgi:cell division protein FtsW
VTAARTRRTPPVARVASPGSPERVLVVAVLALCCVGVLTVYSASQVLGVEETGSSSYFVVRQVFWLLVGGVGALVAARIPLRIWRERLTIPVTLTAVVLLGYVAAGELARRLGGELLPGVVRRNGSTRWLGAGSLQFQPSEVAKLALVLCLAAVLADPGRELGTWRGLRLPLGIAGGLAALVFAGDDLGTTVLLGVVLLAVLWAAGAPFRSIGAIAGALVAAAFVVVRYFEGFRAARLAAFLDPEAYADGAGYQLVQSQIGLATGGLFGLGPGSSRGKWGYLPEAHTDFVVSVVGEEYGLVGTLVVVGLVATVVVSGLAIARRAPTRYSQLLAIGLTVWLGVQAFINLGVTIGLFPTKGITLPFVSYGGSSIVLSLVAVGVLVAVAKDR